VYHYYQLIENNLFLPVQIQRKAWKMREALKRKIRGKKGGELTDGYGLQGRKKRKFSAAQPQSFRRFCIFSCSFPVCQIPLQASQCTQWG